MHINSSLLSILLLNAYKQLWSLFSMLLWSSRMIKSSLCFHLYYCCYFVVDVAFLYLVGLWKKSREIQIWFLPKFQTSVSLLVVHHNIKSCLTHPWVDFWHTTDGTPLWSVYAWEFPWSTGPSFASSRQTDGFQVQEKDPA